MIGNNLSTLGVSASQLDNKLDTTSLMLTWLPTTGEFGLYGTFGDYDYHENVATRFGVHYTSSTEDRQSQPGTDSIENSQIRLTDGSVIFTPGSLRPGHHGRARGLQDVESRRGDQVQGLLARSRVLLALAERLQGNEYLGDRRHRRHRLPGAALGDGPAEDSPALCRRLGDLRRRFRRQLRVRVRASTGIRSKPAACGSTASGSTSTTVPWATRPSRIRWEETATSITSISR